MRKHTLRSFRRYQTLARRTQNPSLTQQERLCHAALGLCAAVEELCREVNRFRQFQTDSTNGICSEAGDVLWMLAELCDTLYFDMNTIFCPSNLGVANNVYAFQLAKYGYTGPKPMTQWRCLYEMGQYAAWIAGRAQKTFQGHNVNLPVTQQNIVALFARLQKVCRQYGFTVYQAMYQNIEKLKERYPEGFSEDRSIHRKEYAE